MNSNVKVIGYLRKSDTKNEGLKNRNQCIERMMERMNEICFTDKIYVSVTGGCIRRYQETREKHERGKQKGLEAQKGRSI
jgi:hypothetical protein